MFLDRDGTLNVPAAPHAYVASAEEFEWLPGAVDAVRRLGDAGYAVVVVSNQRGVARGLVPTRELERINQLMRDDLARVGARVDAVLYCPHDLDDECDCRKPAPGLLVRAAAELELDLGASTMIGDAETDIEAGRAAGCMTIRIDAAGSDTTADLVAADLDAAVDLLLGAGRAA